MNLLILGGTRFAGRFTTERALERGHTVTIFHRGQTNPDLFQGVQRILGDREKDLGTLPNTPWDAVLDFCAYTPKHVLDIFEHLHSKSTQYILISTISVYDAEHAETLHEESATLPTDTLTTPHRITPSSYGPLKRLAELAAFHGRPENTTVVRPGLIVGPHDPTDRFTWWPARIQRSGTIFTPSPPSTPVQFIDARDLAAWLVHLVEERIVGTFNATGPEQALTLHEFLTRCVDTIQPTTPPHFEWVNEDFLTEKSDSLSPFQDLPLWVPRSSRAMCRVDTTRAQHSGLTLRPLEDTLRDTLSWWQSQPDRPMRAGLSAEREKDLMKQYMASKKSI